MADGRWISQASGLGAGLWEGWFDLSLGIGIVISESKKVKNVRIDTFPDIFHFSCFRNHYRYCQNQTGGGLLIPGAGGAEDGIVVDVAAAAATGAVLDVEMGWGGAGVAGFTEVGDYLPLLHEEPIVYARGKGVEVGVIPG